MSVSYIPEKTKIILWGKAAGRCEYRGCNHRLWMDDVTTWEFNSAYIAHIIADSPNGPRGHATLSAALKEDLSNLMLLCDVHHRLVDKQDVAGHPVDLLQQMKKEHESRIDMLTSLQPNRKSEVLLYGARVGEIGAPVSFERSSHGMLPDWYPASRDPITIGTVNNVFTDREAEFWTVERRNLERQFADRIRQRLELRQIEHLSIFAIAPQPLLILLGSLLTDIPNAQVYHLFREPPDWRWRDHPEDFRLDVVHPQNTAGPPALVLSLTATVTDDRITAILGPNASIWKISVPEPAHDSLPSKQALSEYRKSVRLVLDKIKTAYGHDTELHIFPAMGVSTAVELGRIRQPKADMAFRIYDQNAVQGFQHALTISQHDMLEGGAK